MLKNTKNINSIIHSNLYLYILAFSESVPLYLKRSFACAFAAWLSFLPGVDAADALIAQDAGHGMQAGLVLASLGALTAQLHPVLHQIQRLHKHCRAHPGSQKECVLAKSFIYFKVLSSSWRNPIEMSINENS